MQTALQVAASVRLAGVVVVDEPARLFAGCSLSDSQIGGIQLRKSWHVSSQRIYRKILQYW